MAPPESDTSSTAASTGASSTSSVTDAVVRAQQRAFHREQAVDDVPTYAFRGRTNAFDAEVATLSGHLAAVETVLYPVARRRLPEGHASVAAQLRGGRQIERLMRLVQGRLYGDTMSAAMPLDDLQARLTRLARDYADAELEMARRLDSVLTEPERQRLVQRLERATNRAPTRPHPYTPHSRGLARLTFAVCSWWDRAFDAMDNRLVPAMRPPRTLPSLSSWDRYLLGQPGFEEKPAADDLTGRPVASPAGPRPTT